jgi:uncharacterized protein
VDEAGRSPAEHARWLLAQLLDWHRREDKAFWWRFFELAQMTDEELVDEREALGRIAFDADLGPDKKAVLERYRFPIQDHGLKVGREVVNPESVKTNERDWGACGVVTEIDEIGLTVTIRRGLAAQAMGAPKALIPYDNVRTNEQRAALQRVATWVRDTEMDGPGDYRAARDLLLRLSPGWRVPGEPLRIARREAGRGGRAPRHRARTWDPRDPGASGQRQDVHGGADDRRARAGGRRVGVTANSHKVIGNALDAIDKAARKAGVPVRIGQRHGKDDERTSKAAVSLLDNPAARTALANRDVDVVGGTAWLWSRLDMEGSVEVLFIDEAGQFSLANALAVSTAADSLVLLGDPQQLEQPLQGSHPPGAERSALGHVLGDRAVMPDDAGLFLSDTWRLHPDIAAYTSEVFYDGQLGFEPSLRRQALHGVAPADGTGLRWAPVVHAGDPRESIEEATVIAELIRELLDVGATWTNRDGETALLTLEDIVIVAPYNAHVERIQRTLAAAGLQTNRVGTVDKFQGQEAPISIYSMATPTPEEAPRGMEFLYSLNRLNVATSRAHCVAIVVASPELVRVTCHTPRQMQLANALCRFVEMADPGLSSVPGAMPRQGLPPPSAVDRGDQLSWLDGSS